MSGAVGANPLMTKALIASEAISAKEFVKFNADETKVDAVDTAGEAVLGIATESADSDDVTAEKRLNITVLGIEIGIAAATLTAGTPVRVDSTGHVTGLAATTADQNVAGIVMADCVDNDWVPIMLTPGVQNTTV